MLDGGMQLGMLTEGLVEEGDSLGCLGRSMDLRPSVSLNTS